MANLSNINGKFVVEQTTGNVGIGTTDPDYLLHVNSSDVTNGTRLIIENTNGSGKKYGLIADNTGVFAVRDVTAGADRFSISNLGNATFTGSITTPSVLANGFMEIRSDTASLYFENAANNNYYRLKRSSNDFVIDYYNGTTTSDRLTIDSSGNVGIGLDPVYKLDVRGDRIRLNPNSNGFVTAEIQNTTGSFYFGIDNSTGTGFGGANSARCIFSLGDYPMAFYTNSTERMRLKTPGSTIQDVTLQLKTTGASDNAGIMFVNSGNTSSFNDIAGIASFVESGSAKGNLQFWTRNSDGDNSDVATRMTIDSSGNVGITAAASFRFNGAADNTHAVGYDSVIDGSFLRGQNGMRFLTGTGGGTERMRIDSSGNTTITTTSNQGGLTVTSATDNTVLGINNTATGGQNWRLQSIGGGSGSGQGKLLIKVGGGETAANLISFVTDGSGADIKMGIGTTSPAVKLDVDGDIRRSGITSGGYIELGSLPGYAANAYQSLTSGGSLHFANNGKYCAFLEGTDTYFGVLNSSSQTKVFFATGSQNSYLAGSGNFGIGTTTPNPFGWGNKHLTLTTTGINQYVALDLIGTGNAAGAILFGGGNGSGSGTSIGRAQISAHDGSNLVFATNGSNSGASFNERMRITSGGEVLIRRADYTDTTFSLQVGDLASDSYRPIRCTVASTAARTQIAFYNPNGLVGSISTNGSATAYNTSSDYRLKENVVSMTGALDRVGQLKPSRFNFIADADKTVDGFLAHEVQHIVPEAITGEKDAVDKEGNAKYQGIDQSKLVPLLVGAIQELKAEIEILKNK